MENDDLNDIPPQVNLINDKRFNYCINEQTYQVINEKKNLLQALKRQRDDLMIGFEARNRFIYVKNELVNNMMLKRLNITQLKDELVRFESTLKTNKEELSQIKKRIVKKRQSLSTYVQKIEKCKDMLERSKHAAFNKTNNEKDGFNILKLRLIEYEKQRIDELNRFIFDLVEFKPKDDELLHKSTQTALKDARQTVYVNGRWILANDHVVYKIVRSTLPTDGDYMPYFKEFQSAGGPKSESGVGGADDEKLMPNDDHLHFMSSGSGGHHSSSSLSRAHQSSPLTIPSSPTSASAAAAAMLSTSTFGGGASGAGPNSPRSIDRRSTLSGLTFTVQFVNLIAFYLNIVLPYNIPHNKFCTQPLTDDQFQNAVAKLNTNIVYLSINQHIPVTNLLPKHTLENLHHFLTYFREMRIKLREKHSISFPNHIIPLLEEMFTDSDEDNQLIQDSMPNLIFTDNEDWETVPNSNEIPSDDTYTQTQSRQTRAVSTSLISSVLSQFWFKKQQPD